MALLRHVHLPYSASSDEKLLETSHCLGRHIYTHKDVCAGFLLYSVLRVGLLPICVRL